MFAAQVVGAVVGLRRQTDLRRALLPVYAATLAALTDDWLQLRGGERPRSVLTSIAEPRPWRWGRESVDDVLRAFETTEDGLTSTQALERRRAERTVSTRSTLWADLLAELTSPLTGLYASGAALSFLAAAPADVAIIVATRAVNVGVAVWQERRTGQAAESVERLSGPTARVMREGRPTVIPASDVVPGDVLLLAPGDRVAADARVLADDDFATLVEALVEGRTYWRNVRRSLDLLIGGNLGEVGYIVGASLPGLPVLTTRQILMVNMISDILPAIALVLQGPAHRNLADLSREGTAALGKPLQDAILRRGAATAAPSLAAYLVAYSTGGVMQGRTVGFASIVATQLAQTLDAARSREGPNRVLIGSVAGSAGLLAATLFFPPARTLFDLALPSPLSLLLIAGSTLTSVGIARALSASQVSLTLPASLRPRLGQSTAAQSLPAPSP